MEPPFRSRLGSNAPVGAARREKPSLPRSGADQYDDSLSASQQEKRGIGKGSEIRRARLGLSHTPLPRGRGRERDLAFSGGVAVEDGKLPEPEHELIDDAIRSAEQKLTAEKARARRRALQLAREQGYHRLALAIDRPRAGRGAGQLSLFATDPTLFDEPG